VVFRFDTLCVIWVTMALKTITSKHQDFRQISIYLSPHPVDVGQTVGEEIYRQWADFDCTLIRLWESHAIRTNVICDTVAEGRKGFPEYIGGLLPEMTKRGIVEIVNSVELGVSQ
jgi:hypothetical protein